MVRAVSIAVAMSISKRVFEFSFVSGFCAGCCEVDGVEIAVAVGSGVGVGVGVVDWVGFGFVSMVNRTGVDLPMFPAVSLA